MFFLSRSATLCDATIASPTATFHTPFVALGLVPEGCSSVHFQTVMGKDAATKMLAEGWKPTAEEALEVGMIQSIVEKSTQDDNGCHPALRAAAQELGEVVCLLHHVALVQIRRHTTSPCLWTSVLSLLFCTWWYFVWWAGVDQEWVPASYRHGRARLGACGMPRVH